MDFPFLSAILFLPALGAVAVALWPRASARSIKRLSFFFTALVLALALYLFLQFDRSGGYQFQERYDWIRAINAFYYLGVDGLSLLMVVLTATLGFLAVLVSWKIELRPREYFAWLLLLETGILGVFLSMDLLLFFLFWEVELIPMYMLISVWGTGRKEYSALKFVVYTLFGSAFMLAGILALYYTAGTFDMTQLTAMNLEGLRAVLPLSAIFWFIFLAFAIKLPIFPFHTWLPDAHTDAPTAVSVILAGVLLKMGGYGMLRISLGIFPEQAERFAPILVGLAVVNVLYGAAVTFKQKDLKRLIAYSSVSHMGLVLLGVFALSQTSLVGATLQMISHGFVTGMLFALVGLVYEKAHDRNLDNLGGLARQMPFLAVAFTLAGLGALGLPGTSGFIAEFFVFLGSFTSGAFALLRPLTILAALGIVLTAGYILWLLRRVFYDRPLEKFAHVVDADPLEMAMVCVFAVAVLLLGLYPAIITDLIQSGVGPLALW